MKAFPHVQLTYQLLHTSVPNGIGKKLPRNSNTPAIYPGVEI